MENTYLEHHGVLGMKWGVRRYQNPDGSLTAAGRKRATKNRIKTIDARTKAKLKKMREDEKSKVKITRAKAKADAKLEKAKSRMDEKVEEAKNTPTLRDRLKAKKSTGEKSVKDMTNEELQAKIDRIKLENTLASLTPQTKSKGKAFTESLMKDVVAPTAKKVGQQWLEKKTKEMLGLDDKTAKTADDVYKEMKKFNEEYQIKNTYDKNVQEIKSKQAKAEQEAKEASEKAAKEKADAKAEKEAKRAEKKAEREASRDERRNERNEAKEERARQKEAENRFEEARSAAKRKEARESTKKEPEVERYEATGDDIIGEGTSRFNGWDNDSFRKTKTSDTTTGVVATTVGRDYVNQFLLEDEWK